MGEKITYTFLFLIFCCSLQSQNEIDLPFLEQNEEIKVDEELIENISLYLENNLKINQVSFQELSEFPLFNRKIALIIKSHIHKFGYFKSINELLTIPGIKKSQKDLLKSLISFSEPVFINSKPKLWIACKWKRKLELAKGFKNNQFLGSADYSLLKISATNLPYYSSFGLTLEKDPGEAFWKQGVDFINGFYKFQSKKIILILGDYKVKNSLGLNLFNGFRFYSFFQPSLLNVTNKNLSPHFSSSEQGFQRGACFSTWISNFKLSSWVSAKKFDANIDAFNRITSFIENGLHRDENELGKKNSGLETMLGFSLEKQFKKGNIGLTHNSIFFNKTLHKSNYYSPLIEKKGFHNISFDISYSAKYFKWKQEVCLADYRHFASQTILIKELSKNTQINIDAIFFDKNYFNIKSNGILGSTSSNSISGLASINYTFSNSTNFDFYSSYSKPLFWSYLNQSFHPKTKYGVRFIKLFKKDNLIRASLEQYAQWNNQVLEKEIQPQKLNKLIFKFFHRIKITDQITSTLNLVYNKTETEGYLIAYKIRRKFKNIAITSSLSYFSAENYQNRIYLYENDIPYEFSSKLNYKSGIRLFLLLKYKWRKMNIQLKYSSTKYSEIYESGSGNNTIISPTRREIKLFFKRSF